MKKLSAVLLALALSLGAAGRIQAQEPTPSHLAAAIEYLETMRVAQSMDASINTMLELQMQANPQMREVEGVMRDFFKRYMTWDRLKNDYARIYTNAFTEAELRQLTAFYRTPLGQKTALAMPRLMQEGAELGQRAVMEHMGELQQMIMDHLQRQQPGTPAPAPRP